MLCFFGDSDTKMQWAEVFRLRVLMASVVMIFAILPVGEVLLWHLLCVQGILPNSKQPCGIQLLAAKHIG